MMDRSPPSAQSHRQVLNAILWRLHPGAQRREIPERYGPWKTVYPLAW